VVFGHRRFSRRVIGAFSPIERRRRTAGILRWLGGGGFTATLQRNPNVDAESVLLRLLELPAALFDRQGHDQPDRL
jgi:hypothetical protein